jgi:hypothetical protein
LKCGAYYTTSQDNITYHWLRGASHKTYEGRTEWMVPELAKVVINVLVKLSEPTRTKIKQRIIKLTKEGMANIQEISTLKNIQSHLFLAHGKSRDGYTIVNIRGNGWNTHLKDFAQNICGLQWNLTSHQLRRKFADYVAHNAMGDLRYLRHHFKHWSMDMTALYAMNEEQDAELYDEILASVKNYQVKIVDHWLDDDSLISGGAASNIKSFRRNHRVKTINERKELAEQVSDQVTIRGTGHGWCLSDTVGCGGKGLYKSTRCIQCDNGVIDITHLPIWQGIYKQQLELLNIKDIGIGGLTRVKRDIGRVTILLQDLGVEISENKEENVDI